MLLRFRAKWTILKLKLFQLEKSLKKNLSYAAQTAEIGNTKRYIFKILIFCYYHYQNKRKTSDQNKNKRPEIGTVFCQKGAVCLQAYCPL